MCQRSIFARSASRLAEEQQLQAEEEFIVEAIKMIRQQRNCLQIERLHLESLKQQLMSPVVSEDSKQSSKPEPNKSTIAADSNPPGLMSAMDMMNLGSKKQGDQDPSMDEDMQCNTQELNLNATLAGTSKPTYNRYSYNSDDDSSSSEGSNEDDVMIDMNMFMNGSNDRN